MSARGHWAWGGELLGESRPPRTHAPAAGTQPPGKLDAWWIFLLGTLGPSHKKTGETCLLRLLRRKDGVAWLTTSVASFSVSRGCSGGGGGPCRGLHASALKASCAAQTRFHSAACPWSDTACRPCSRRHSLRFSTQRSS